MDESSGISSGDGRREEQPAWQQKQPGALAFPPAAWERYFAKLRSGMGKWKAARACGVSPETVRRLRRASEDFASQERDAILEAVDEAVDVLWEAMREKQPWAVAMVLKRLGEQEVWSPVAQVAVSVEGSVKIEGGEAGVDAALRRLAVELAERRDAVIEVTGGEQGALGAGEGGMAAQRQPASLARVPGEV